MNMETRAMHPVKEVLIGLIVVFLSSQACLQAAPERTHLPKDVMERSHAYIEKLTERSFAELNTEEKLLLLHAYYNVGDDQHVVHIGQLMTVDLDALEPDRQVPFREMIEESKCRISL